jgi:S1-C subfamily serine protease
LNQLLEYGRVTRGAVGLDIITLDSFIAGKERASSGVALLPPDGTYSCGLLITNVLPGKPGEAAGLEEGDVILAINGERCTRKGSFFKALGPVYEEKRVLKCLIWRPGKPGGAGGQYLRRELKPIPRTQVRKVRGMRG